MAPTPGPVLEAGHGSQVQVEEGSFPMTPRGHSMTVTHAKGLLNMPGQNNCFLNSAVQVLWHLDIFRRSFRELSGHACMAESCIFCALKELFTQFQYSQESALPPDALRHALAKTFCDQRRFQLGFMDDAAECFENILLRIHVHIANQEHEDMCGDVQCIPHQKFAMTLVEQPVCHNCGTTSEPLPFTQMVHYVTTSALCSKAFEMQDQEHGSAAQNSFGRLLKIAGNVGEVRECSSGCGSKFQVKKTLMNHPEIVSIGLVWDSECPSLQHITDVFHSIGMCLRLQDMFHSVYDYDWAKETSHELVGVVTYYGKHYSTFFFHTKLKVWIYFDDATVREIGPNWEQVVEKCQKGRFQPLLLLFANPNGSSFPPSTIAHEQSHQNVALKVGPNPNSSNQKQAVMHKYLMLQNSFHNNNLRTSYKPVTERTNPLQSYSKYDPSAYPMLSAVLNSHQNSVKNQMASANSRVIGQSSSSPVYSNGNGIGIPYPTFYYNTESNNMKVSACDSSTQLKHIYSNVNISKYPPQGPETQLHPQLSDISKANETCLPPITTLKYSSRSTPQFSENSEPPQFKPNEFVDSTKDSDSAFTEEDPECNETYISRKAVENVLNLQKLQRQISLSRSYSHTSVGNRNSSSSLESFENVHCNKNAVPRDHVLESSNFPVRRDSRDSGNWSVSDRNSSSSNTSTENPFLTMVASKRLLLGLNMHSSVGKGQLPDYSNTSTSDHGYDSYSVSSSDSYPSINNSPVKLDPRLTQIPEDWNGQDNLSDLDKKLMMITEESLGPPDCDKLCAEADLLLAKSHDKEKEGDLVMAALLCDSAAARARAAMDAPYNNSRSLVSAKMKHSTCVLRSSCLYRRLKDNEAEEKRKQKGNHSRQSSRDSTHSRHSRQGSKDSTHSKQTQKDNSQQVFEETENFGKNIEIYGTLPKKGSRKKSSSPGSSKAKDDQVYKDFLDKQRKNTNVSTSPNESTQKNNKQPIRLENGKGKCDTSNEKQQKKNIIDSISAKSTLRKVVPTPSKDFSIGNNAKRWTAKQPLIEQSYLGLFPLQDSDFSDDRELTNRDLLSPLSSPDKKQHRIKRRLMGGFMKRKNRSLPDLRADEDLADPVDRSIDDVAIQIPSILTLPNGKLKKLDYQSDANVSNVSRGFHQPHYAFVKKDLTQRPLLMKVNPPNVQYSVVSSPNPKSVHTLPSLPKKPTESKTRVALNFNSDKPSKIPFMTFPKHEMPSSAVLQPLKSVESQPQQQVTPQRVSSIPVLTSQVIAPLTKSVTFKEESQVLPIVSNNLLSNNKDDLPPPSNPFLAEIQAKRKQIIDAKSQQNTETKKEIRNLKTLQPIANREIPSLLPKLTTTNDGASWLKELQTKQLQMRHKQGESVIPLPKADKKIQDIPKIIGNISVAETGTLKNSSNPAVLSSGNLTKLTETNGANTSFKLPESTAHEITRNHAKNITNVNTERKSTSSVKDLASRFEKILIKPKDIVSSSYDSSSAINAETNAIDGKPDSNNMCNINSSLLQDEIHRNQRFEEGVMPTENAMDMQSQPQRTNLSNEFCADTNTHYNDYTNMNCQRTITESDIPVGTSNANAPIVQRPQRPPDYETAMLRLEFIRTTPGTTNDSTPSHLNLNTDSRPQRKKGPKKTVTFSDEVVLVACAEFDDSGFLANPLLERVYQQHIEAGGSEISHFSAVGSYKTDPSEVMFSNPAGDYSQVKDNGHIESTMGNPDAQSSNDAVPCHLCHNKHVSPPIIYCTDCEFYMSRFQP